MDAILEKWNSIKPTESQDDAPEAGSGRRRPNVLWTRNAALLVLQMVDTTRVSKRYTNKQICEQLNRPETEEIYKHPRDVGRVFTPSNIQAFLKKMFPPNADTQAGVNALERAKTWPGWGNLSTHTHVVHDRDGKMKINRLTVNMPLARELLAEYGEFILIDCTFKLTIYEGRFTIFISVVDDCGHVHPTHVADVPGHRECDWLESFDSSWDLVKKQCPAGKKLKHALLMRDGEEAITKAWEKSKWPKVSTTGR